jgi:hypothetical protein
MICLANRSSLNPGPRVKKRFSCGGRAVPGAWRTLGADLSAAQDTRTMPKAHPRPWHRGSVFGDGLRRPLDRGQRATFNYLVKAHRRAGRLTACAKDVAEALLRRLGTSGQLDPTHERIAEDADCDTRTVRRALDALRAVGLVIWQCRLVRDGWRCAQTSSAYMLLTPAGNPPEFRAARCGGQNVRETKTLMNQGLTYLPLMSDRDREAAKVALARRRAAVEARLLGKGTVG